jgi:hypothetical protein
MKIEVSVGEIVDKMTILEIKKEKCDSDEKLKNIEYELNYLTPIVEELNVPQNLIDSLRDVNKTIWNVEDNIRNCEKNKVFDETFIQLARDVYHNNDQRFYVKNEINQLTNSQIKEQKILPKYN